MILLTQISIVRTQDDPNLDYISYSTKVILINRYAPILQFKAEENFFPVDINYHLNNSILKMRYWEDVSVIDYSPSSSTIAKYTADNYFLDNKLSFEEIIVDYSNKKQSLGYTVYARVTKQFDFIVVQYWFFYAYNYAAMNRHEGDWECIEILLDSLEEPVSTAYSQHLMGQRASWNDVNKINGTHPIVYVAKGSHANYYRPFQGRLGSENDDVGADGVKLYPSNMNVIILGELGVEKNSSTQHWLEFGGRWGDWTKLTDVSVGYAGPYGPGKGENLERWYSPVNWAQNIPLVDRKWFIVSWFAANLFAICLSIVAIISAYKIHKIVLLQKRRSLRLLKLLRTKAAMGILIGFAGTVLPIGGALLPWYRVRTNIQTTIISSEGTVDLIILDGIRGAQVNFLSEAGLSSLFNIRISFWILIFAGILFGTLDILGVEKAKNLGNKYLRRGITFFILMVPIIIFVHQITSNLRKFSTNLGVYLPPEVIQIAHTVAKNPFRGVGIYQVENFGSVYLEWGFQVGTYLFIASALLRILGGVILLRNPEFHSSTTSYRHETSNGWNTFI